ncbi:MAG: hypothetical protein ACQESP_12085 [Candidatus Muiribacteriota bacterium]
MFKKFFMFSFLIISFSIVSYSQSDFYEFIHEESINLYNDYGKETSAILDRNNEFLGKETKFWAMEPLTFDFYELNATLKKIGKHCYIYVENGQKVDNNAIEKFAEEFDNNIYPSVTTFFGSENNPGIDNDEKITLLFLDIKDGYNTGNSDFIAGYYFPPNEYKKSKYEHSNEREMVYIDVYPSDPNSEFSLSIIAHEFQHMVHWNNDPEEDLWLNEAMSQLAIKLCGYSHPGQIYKYAKNPELSLVQFHPEYMVENYGITYLFVYNIMLDFFKNNPADFTFNLVKNQKKGLDSIEQVLSNFNYNIKSKKLFNEFALKNIINLSGTDYYYENSLKDFMIHPLKVNNFTSSLTMDRVVTYGADYLRYESDNSFNTITFDFVGVKDSAWAYFPYFVEYDIFAITYFDFDKINSLNVNKLELDSDNQGCFTFSDFGFNYNTLDIVVINNTKNESVAYKYKASKKNVLETNEFLSDKKAELQNSIKKVFVDKNPGAYKSYINLIQNIDILIEKNNFKKTLR